MYKFFSTEQVKYSPLEAKIVPKLDTDIIIESLGLDTWQAIKIPNFREDAQEVGKSFMIRRFNKRPEENAENHDVVLKRYISEKYRVLQYDKGIRWLDPFLMEKLLKVHSVFYVEPGSKLCVTSEIGVEAEVVPGDTVRRYLILVLSHDGSTRMLGFTDICPVCENTLQTAKLQAANKADKHFNLDVSAPEYSLKKARETIDLVHQRFFKDDLLKYNAYSQLTLEKEQIDYIFRRLINAPINKELEKLPNKLRARYQGLQTALEESPGQYLRGENTGWAVLGAVTNFAKEITGTEVTQYMNDLLGTGNRMRKHTIEMLDELLPDNHIPVTAGF